MESAENKDNDIKENYKEKYTCEEEIDELGLRKEG
jgi:hypothetical protein